MKNSLQHEGPKATAYKFYRLLMDSWFDIREWWFDIKYGTDTSGIIQPEHLAIKSPKKYGRYEPTKVVLLERLFSHIKPILPPDSVLVDFGCGKGRVLLMASEFGFREARGVEYAHDLCDIAISNCSSYKRTTAAATNFRIVEGDACDYEINTDENCFFFFDPFGQAIMRKVLDNIRKSLEVKPRKVLIIYHNPRFPEIILKDGVFTEVSDWGLLHYRFIAYSNNGIIQDNQILP
jgi:SAM-dependent methyltransferase